MAALRFSLHQQTYQPKSSPSSSSSGVGGVFDRTSMTIAGDKNMDFPFTQLPVCAKLTVLGALARY